MGHIKYIVLILLKNNISTQDLLFQAREKSGKKLIGPEIWTDTISEFDTHKKLKGDHRQILSEVADWVKEGGCELLICTSSNNLFSWLGIGLGAKYGGLEVQTDFIEISSASE